MSNMVVSTCSFGSTGSSVITDYLKEFNKTYPGINVIIESATDYDFDVKNRLLSGNWGEVCGIPTGIELSELYKYFEPYFNTTDTDIYNLYDADIYNDVVYGIPTSIDVQGIVYNKKVFESAGIKELPKTPDEFLSAMQLIKDNTNAIPIYTNYEAGWPLVNWDFHAVGSAVGIDNYMNDIMLTEKRPFTNRLDNTGPYAVYKLLYDCVANGFVEDDPHGSSWELCKGRMCGA